MFKNKHKHRPRNFLLSLAAPLLFLAFQTTTVSAATVSAGPRFEWGVGGNTIEDTQTHQIYEKKGNGIFNEKDPPDGCKDQIVMKSKDKGTFFENTKGTDETSSDICGTATGGEPINNMGHQDRAGNQTYIGSQVSDPDCVKISVKIDGSNCVGGSDKNPIYVYLRGIIKFLSAGVGVVVMLMIVISGIQYITSSGNPDAVQAAKKRLTNAILALVLFIFMFAILNFLVPGGLLE